jgi:hypothetical protein
LFIPHYTTSMRSYISLIILLHHYCINYTNQPTFLLISQLNRPTRPIHTYVPLLPALIFSILSQIHAIYYYTHTFTVLQINLYHLPSSPPLHYSISFPNMTAPMLHRLLTQSQYNIVHHSHFSQTPTIPQSPPSFCHTLPHSVSQLSTYWPTLFDLDNLQLRHLTSRYCKQKTSHYPSSHSVYTIAPSVINTPTPPLLQSPLPAPKSLSMLPVIIVIHLLTFHLHLSIKPTLPLYTHHNRIRYVSPLHPTLFYVLHIHQLLSNINTTSSMTTDLFTSWTSYMARVKSTVRKVSLSTSHQTTSAKSQSEGTSSASGVRRKRLISNMDILAIHPTAHDTAHDVDNDLIMNLINDDGPIAIRD